MDDESGDDEMDWQVDEEVNQDKTGEAATSNDMKLVHWPLMGGLLHLVQ